MADGAGTTNGLATALQLLGAAGVGGAGDGEDDGLFGCEDAPLPLPLAKGSSGPKGGRPRGARNKSTDEWVRFFLARHQSPLMVLGNIMSQPAAELYDTLQAMADKHKTWRETKDGGYWERVAINPLDVLKLQRDAAVALAPYIHQQQPKALEIHDKPRGIVLLGEIQDMLTAEVDDLALPLAGVPDEVEAGSVQNQQVAAAPPEQSDVAQSDNATNPLTFRDE